MANTSLTTLEQLKLLAEKNHSEVKDLETKIEGIVSKGGEPNTIESVKVNGTALEPDGKKAVDITVEEGATNGTVKVNGTDVKVKGLNSLAYKEKVAKTDLDNSLTTEIEGKEDKTVVATIKSDVDTLKGEDSGKSARDIAKLAVAELLNGADGSYDTLIEISNWIKQHADSAAGMNSEIQENAKAIEKLEALFEDFPEDEHDTIVEYVADAIETAIEELELDTYAKKTELNGLIKKTDLSADTTGAGNVVSEVTYDNASGKVTATKGVTALTSSDIATNDEVNAMLSEVFDS